MGGVCINTWATARTWSSRNGPAHHLHPDGQSLRRRPEGHAPDGTPNRLIRRHGASTSHVVCSRPFTEGAGPFRA
jgi:hypothetical protein